VQVFQEPDLDREIRVSQDGAISLPLVGQVDVKGHSLSAIEKTVRELYDRDYLVNPQVTVTVVKYQVRTVNVMGAVNQPQAVDYPPEQTLSVLDAISRAGGFNRFADRKKVVLTRTYTDGHSEKFTINADQLISGTATERWVLLKDDVIFVPESVL
jgi:polysaccharide export outer membrane protein